MGVCSVNVIEGWTHSAEFTLAQGIHLSFTHHRFESGGMRHRLAPMVQSPRGPKRLQLFASAQNDSMGLLRLYHTATDLTRSATATLGARYPGVEVTAERCFNIETSVELTPEQNARLRWLLTDFSEDDAKLTGASLLPPSATAVVIELGPRLNVCTPFSTNAVSICTAVGMPSITRVEVSRRYSLTAGAGSGFSAEEVAPLLHDRMTEFVYPAPLETFGVPGEPEQFGEVDVLGGGTPALQAASDELGLAFDAADLEYYTTLFQDKIQRNPTTVEAFDLSQSNSEHSRHWFFCGRLVIDGVEQELSLMKIIKKTQTDTQPNNSIIAFHDNSSCITGFEMPVMLPGRADGPSDYSVDQGTRQITLTAETHNFPTGVAPFPGATTGTGGRIRDNQATGRGAHVIAGTAGYCVGNLQIPGYELPWEDATFPYPSATMASPLDIEIQASNGASQYGNHFGEPIISGFTRSFGMRLPDSTRREWVKPIMFTAGLGSMDSRHAVKQAAEPGMVLVKVGGPAYRIGMGGGAASSVDVQGDSTRDAGLDFNAVQRGDAEMEQKMNRVVRACIELGEKNIICSIHDQGAGGNGNVLKEICEPAGAVIRVKNFVIGDPTLSAMELWGAEYQENCALLIEEKNVAFLQSICDRERVPVAFVGTVTGDGRVTLVEGDADPADKSVRHPFDMSLAHVLSEMPRKVFKSDRAQLQFPPLSFPADMSVRTALDRVFRLVSVGSKRFLTNKVDRSVTGLVAQQQCVGPLHTPLANVAVVALSHFGGFSSGTAADGMPDAAVPGAATSIGEQPIIGLVDVAAGARMSVGEALTNMVWAPITDLKDVKCSGNWMWAAKMASEGAALHDACVAMCDIVTALGFALDGGKDSLSMAAVVPGEEQPVKAPGELVISAYAGCTDVRLTVTPDLVAGEHTILFVDISGGEARLGGSALAQTFSQLGDTCPDVDAPPKLEAAFRVTQQMVKDGKLLAGHDRSDGGLVTTLLEMAFAGNCGIAVDVPVAAKAAAGVPTDIATLFAEELGLVLQVSSADAAAVQQAYTDAGVLCSSIGQSTSAIGVDAHVTVAVGGVAVIDNESMPTLRDLWEATSGKLEMLQATTTCVADEATSLSARGIPPFHAPAEMCPDLSPHLGDVTAYPKAHRVAVIREEGSNGDREMSAALVLAGFAVSDITMQDLRTGATTLTEYRGVVFVGGFSYADTCGSAKGWGAGVLYNDKLKEEFTAFRNRADTFSLGICNGCQLMGLLGWVGSDTSVAPREAKAASPKRLKEDRNTVFTHNASRRFESRFASVAVGESPSIMLAGMAGTTLGVWVAHGEGRAKFSSDDLLADVLDQNLAPVRYVDDSDSVTEAYPFNPNGSPEGIAGLCSADGRHLAMMPHPERCVLLWQWPWMPAEWKETMSRRQGASPWMRMFTNAYDWCSAAN